jgi:hypothetical protein
VLIRESTESDEMDGREGGYEKMMVGSSSDLLLDKYIL